MTAYYLHDGQNEVGPFTIDSLKRQNLTRNTPIREYGSNNWLPAEKLDALKDLVAPKKVRRPKDILPVISEKFTHLQRKNPLALYGTLLGLAVLACLSIYSVTSSAHLNVSAPVPQIQSQVSAAVALPVAVHQASTAEVIKPTEKNTQTVVKEDKTKATRLHWTKLISATNSNYGIGLLGGIKDLNVVLTNRTEYPIDEAVLKVTYIKANGGIWKTKLVTVFGVPAHESKEESVPDVGRGKKVKVGIYKIVSKKMNFSYTEGQKINNPLDPYQTK